ncbi:MAG: universal stress protein [Desulfovibrionaceae bacterium]
MPYGSNIVCGIDESAASVHACRQAIGLPGKRRTAHAVAVLPPVPMAWDHSVEAVDELDRELAGRRGLLRDNLDRLTSSCCGDIPVETSLIQEGLPHEGIVEKAREVGADLIVLGARKATGALQHRMLGAVSSRVVGYACCDVLMVPEDVNMRAAGLLVPVDGSGHAARAVRRGVAIAKEFGLPLTFLAVAPVPEGLKDYSLNQLSVDRLEERARETADAARAEAAKAGVEAAALVRTGSPSLIIVAVARELGAGLILMGSHGRTGLKRLLMGSTTERVLQLSPCPVLVTRIGD